MARRPDGSGRFSIPPGARRIVGWVAAVVIIVLVAVFVGILGGNADGTPVAPGGPGGSSTPTPAAASAIRFGTALDPATGEVAVDAETDRFVEADPFAYSYRPDDPPPTTVWVEVRRQADGSGEPVQTPAPHALADDARVVAFEVPAAALFRDFGIGAFQMRIYLAEDDPPAAVGSFELVGPSSSPTP